MWTVAKTLDDSNDDSSSPKEESGNGNNRSADPLLFGKLPVPTNACQTFLLDGVTRPTLLQRMGSFVTPVIALFRAGMISSAVGYGIADLLIRLRSVLLPSYAPVTQPINVLYASIYTGCFMAVVSNMRYQLLQGLVEPMLDRVLARVVPSSTILRNGVIFLVRWMNGLLGSILAIMGMRACGLQKLR
jgi:hypothetical protein